MFRHSGYVLFHWSMSLKITDITPLQQSSVGVQFLTYALSSANTMHSCTSAMHGMHSCNLASGVATPGPARARARATRFWARAINRLS